VGPGLRDLDPLTAPQVRHTRPSGCPRVSKAMPRTLLWASHTRSQSNNESFAVSPASAQDLDALSQAAAAGRGWVGGSVDWAGTAGRYDRCGRVGGQRKCSC
jgi:hypothetical protein